MMKIEQCFRFFRLGLRTGMFNVLQENTGYNSGYKG
jgi:hypothetical protein